MATERMQRRIDALLDEADVSVTAGEWASVAEKARAVLAIDEANEDAAAFLKMAAANAVTNRPGSEAEPDSPASAVTSAAGAVLPSSFAGGRYAVRRFLGEGGRKRV